MTYRTLTLPLLGIILFFAAYLAWPKMDDSKAPLQQKLVSMPTATPHREKAEPKKETKTKKIPVRFGLKASFIDPNTNK